MTKHPHLLIALIRYASHLKGTLQGVKATPTHCLYVKLVKGIHHFPVYLSTETNIATKKPD